MGHTVTSQRRMIDLMLSELESYGKALREEERLIYLKLLKKSLKKIGAISYTSSIHVWAMLLLSIILEQEKKIIELENVANGLISMEKENCFLDKGQKKKFSISS